MSNFYARPHGPNSYGSGRGIPGPGFSGSRLVRTRDQLNQIQELLDEDDRLGGSDSNGSDSESRDSRAARPGLGSRGGSHTARGSSEGRPRLGLRGGAPGSGGRRSSPASSMFDEIEDDDDDRLAEQDHFGRGPAFGRSGSRFGEPRGHWGSRSGGRSSFGDGSPFHGGPYASGPSSFPDPRARIGFHPRGDIPLHGPPAGGGGFARRGPPFAGNRPFFGDLASGRRFPRNPYQDHPDYRGDYGTDDDFFVPHGPNRGFDFDSEFLHGAVGNEEDLDDIISRLMAAGPRHEEGPPPASQSAIANLEKKKVDRSMLGADGKANCSICMEDVAVGEDVTELPCKHWFHGSCITSWLSSHDTCPHCRKSITSNEGPVRRNRPVPRDSARPDPEGEYYRPTMQYDEALAQRMQRRLGPRAREDEAYARRLQEEYNASAQDDEGFARRLQGEYVSPVHGDEEMARRLQREDRSSTYDDEALARRLQEENLPSTDDDEAFARRLQEENDHERGNYRAGHDWD